MRGLPRLAICMSILGLHAFGTLGAEPDEVIPHAQSKVPNKPLSPAEAVRKMTLPDGFTVEVVASEPDIVNPVAMTFDERGRVWLTESLEYPRKSPGPGRDRVKILEDSDGDGKADKFSIFADGFNIPSGIAVGHGGVWVANSPDLLFLRDTDGDGKADQREMVVTGFGRSDTHELPNSLSWGPDGWLYGWNGVFNPSHIEYRGKIYDFTCAIFRINPHTREFELYCEGTSNPWGITWDSEGSTFASACVIDHLWHLTESGYYHRQGGPYPPYTWKIESIVGHLHQQAAYCGIHYYESDAYPERYRGKLFMGNIHANGVNLDRLSRQGSTYRAESEEDFLNANDSWFMPVAQKTGPDGSLYVLDWYDRYHCYQDANRDPAGIDRLKGRLYRVRYKETPRRSGFDLAKETDDQLIKRLGSPNGFDRETSRRLLAEREGQATDKALQSLALDTKAPRIIRMNAIWTRISRATTDAGFLASLMEDKDSVIRAWGVRATGNLREKSPTNLGMKVVSLASDPSADVQLQVAIAARKLMNTGPIDLLVDVASACGDDPLIPHIVWQNMLPYLDDKAQIDRFTQSVTMARVQDSPALLALIPRVVDRALGRRNPEEVGFAGLIERLIDSDSKSAIETAIDSLESLARRVQSGELKGASLDAFKRQFQSLLLSLQKRPADDPLKLTGAILSASWKDPSGLNQCREAATNTRMEEGSRLDAVNALVAAGDEQGTSWVENVLRDKPGNSLAFRGKVIASLGRIEGSWVAASVLRNYPEMEPELQSRALELLTQRTAWVMELLVSISGGKIPSSALNLNQIRKLAASKDTTVLQRVKAIYGTVREGRNPEREQVIERNRKFLNKTPGDALAGSQIFKRVCGQCHKIYGEGQEVGPEITLNGRGSYDQLLSNVFDPSLVIGTAYQGTTVATTDGRLLTGLVVEQTPERVVLKLQGGKLETIPKGQVEELKGSPLSLMPEDLDKQLSPQELADLFAYITLDKPPTDPKARAIPGAEDLPRVRRETR